MYENVDRWQSSAVFLTDLTTAGQWASSKCMLRVWVTVSCAFMTLVIPEVECLFTRFSTIISFVVTVFHLFARFASVVFALFSSWIIPSTVHLCALMGVFVFMLLLVGPDHLFLWSGPRDPWWLRPSDSHCLSPCLPSVRQCCPTSYCHRAKSLSAVSRYLFL